MYWPRGYWHERYWQLSYWQQGTYSGSIAASLENFTAAFQASGNTGSYWPLQYWATQYWASGYWKTGTPGNATGTIAVTLEGVTSQIVGATTWTEYVDLSVNVSLAWQITAYDAYAGTIAVTLDNATSAATGSVLPPDSVSGFINARTDDAAAAFAGTHTAPGDAVGTIVASVADVSAALVGVASAVSASTGTISVTLQDASAAFTGANTIPEITGSIAATLDNVQPSFTGFVLEGYANVGYIIETLDDLTSAFLGTLVNPVPEPANAGTPIENSNAIQIPSNYEICDRTGFKLKAGELRKEWNGAMVRPQSWEARHPQDFVRGRAERHRGSPRPEQADVFIEDDEPVTADDL